MAINCHTRSAVAMTPLLLQLLSYLDVWRSERDLAREYNLGPADQKNLIAGLRASGLVEARSTSRGRAGSGSAWKDWGQLAAAFHFGTRNTRFPTDPVRAERDFQLRTRGRPAPGPTMRQGPRVALSSGIPTSVGAQLQLRRTWRSFGTRPVSREQCSTLLALTFGVSIFATGLRGEKVALKTSPSGGSRHPIEAYVAINGVAGIARGLYHFNSWNGHLTQLRRGITKRTLQGYIPSQPWFWPAPMTVFMTAVFERTSWRYPAPRAYRNVLIEAGHLAQSFCLLATELGLASFTTHAFDDSRIDRDLGLNGVDEGVIYAVGCGTVPQSGWKSRIPGLNMETL